MEFRTLQDWVIRPILRTVAGVTDVNSLGGYPKQYHVMVGPNKLIKYGLTLRQVFEAIGDNNANVGGGYIRHQQESYAVRGLGNTVELFSYLFNCTIVFRRNCFLESTSGISP